jgi:predicted nuclease of predicted toxin-antitoxin system
VTGFLLDENLPSRLRFTPSLPVKHVRELGKSPMDIDIWTYAKENNLVIPTKDADFSDRMLVSEPPPKIVHLRFGNLRLAGFHSHLAKVWTRVEELLETNKLINVYLDRIEGVGHIESETT